MIGRTETKGEIGVTRTWAEVNNGEPLAQERKLFVKGPCSSPWLADVGLHVMMYAIVGTVLVDFILLIRLFRSHLFRQAVQGLRNIMVN